MTQSLLRNGKPPILISTTQRTQHTHTCAHRIRTYTLEINLHIYKIKHTFYASLLNSFDSSFSFFWIFLRSVSFIRLLNPPWFAFYRFVYTHLHPFERTKDRKRQIMREKTCIRTHTIHFLPFAWLARCVWYSGNAQKALKICKS